MLYFKTFNSKLSYIEVWFPDQNYRPIQIKNEINIKHVKYKK